MRGLWFLLPMKARVRLLKWIIRWQMSGFTDKLVVHIILTRKPFC
jgi:hypothetical protein